MDRMNDMIAALSPSESVVYRALARAAAGGKPCPGNDALGAMIGAVSPSTTPGIIKRLEAKGLVRVERYQRHRRVHIVASGASTAAPPDSTPHWRDRPRGVPAPAPALLAERRPDLAGQIAAWGRGRGVSMAEALADLVFVGWEVERARG